MKKILTVCIMLAALVFLAYAGTEAAKVVKSSDVAATVSAPSTKIDKPMVNTVETVAAPVVDEETALLDELKTLTEEVIAMKDADEEADVSVISVRILEIQKALGLNRAPERSLDADGDDCLTPFIIPGFPYYASGNTLGSLDNYDATCLGSYDDGEEQIYTFTLNEQTCLQITMDPGNAADGLPAAYTSVALMNACPQLGTVCVWQYGNSGTENRVSPCLILAAGTYYIMVDIWESPDFTFAYDLSVVGCVCPEVGRCCYGTNNGTGGILCAIETEAACIARTNELAWTVGITDCVANPCVGPIPTGRCCYGTWYSPTCLANTTTSTEYNCLARTNEISWTAGITTCTGNACPIVLPQGCPTVFDPYGATCATAAPVSVPGQAWGTTVGAANYVWPGGTCGTTAGNGSVWYMVVGTGNTITATTCDVCTFIDTKLRVFTCGCATMSCVGGNDDMSPACPAPARGNLSSVSFCSILGQEYLIEVAAYSTTIDGQFMLHVTDDGIPCTGAVTCPVLPWKCCYGDVCAPTCADMLQGDCAAVGGVWTENVSCAIDPVCPTPLPGDVCCNALPLTVPGTFTGTTVGFVNNYDFACTYTGSTAPDVVYVYTSPVDQQVTFDLCLSSYDTKLYIYDTNCGVNPPLYCNDDYYFAAPCYSYSSALLCKDLLMGHTYYIVVDGYGSSSGAYNLETTVCVPCPPEEIPWNDVCANVSAAGCDPVGPGVVMTASGNVECATTGDCGGAFGDAAVVWECFTLTECGTITVDYCGSDGLTGGSVFTALMQDCDCANYVAYSSIDWYACVGGPTLTFANLPAGTYYIPIHPTRGPNYIVTVTFISPCPIPYECECCFGPTAHSADPTPDLPIFVTLPPTVLTIPVPIQYSITDVNVCFDIVHTWDSDLTITLQSPMGTIVTLAAGNGGSGQNFLFTVVDDESPYPISGGVAPFNHCYSPVGLLSDFDGENAVGNWLLTVTDCCGGDDGTLNYACLTFQYDEILPVELTSFDAIAGDRAVTLNWATASEINNDYYRVIRNGENVGEVNASVSTTGGTYTYTDNGLTNGTSYDYSVVSVSLSGDIEEVFTISATPSFSAATITEYSLHQNFPNPFNPETKITFDLVDAGFVSLSVYNLLGQQVSTLVNSSMEAGRHIVSFDANNLPSGLYLYRMDVNGFSAQKKMVLMK